MKVEDVLVLPGTDNPVLCVDGLMGMLIHFPTAKAPMCGVQVPGEQEARLIHVNDLTASAGGALKQSGAPRYPKTPSGPNRMVQLLLSMDFAQRGADFVLEGAA